MAPFHVLGHAAAKPTDPLEHLATDEKVAGSNESALFQKLERVESEDDVERFLRSRRPGIGRLHDDRSTDDRMLFKSDQSLSQPVGRGPTIGVDECEGIA